MSAPTVDVDALACPRWCDQQHGVEHEFGDVWVSHTASIEEPIEGTDRSAVVWIDALNDSAPRLVITHDCEGANGEIHHYEGLPPAGLERAEAAALAIALQKAMAAIAGTETTR